MNKFNKSAIAIALTLGLAATAWAHQDEKGHERKEGQRHSMHEGKDHGCTHGKQGRAHGGDSHAARQLMTPEERTAMREKMRNAKTPEERQQIALANRAEMQKRATEKGITLPEHRGRHGHGGMGPNSAPKAPVTPEAAQ